MGPTPIAAVLHLLTILCTATAFLTSPDTCAAPPPCTCPDVSQIDCSGKHLTQIPHFRNITKNTGPVILDLQGNRITEIPAKAFEFINTNSFTVWLNGNQVSNINASAFEGIENVTKDVSLYGNRLHDVPPVFAKLHKITDLDLAGNPISTYPSNILQSLGRTLLTFRMSLRTNNTWPAGLRFLRKLQAFTIQGMQMDILLPDAFHGFEKTLHKLYIYSSHIDHAPTAICQAVNLVHLTFFSNTLRSSNDIIPSCSHPLYKVTSLELNYNNLTTFLPVFETFPNLTDLQVVNNNYLYFIDESVIPSDNKVISLNLAENAFQRVPAAILKFKRLKSLSLSQNSISTIEYTDLNFKELNSLFLDTNPTTFISKDAFKHLPLLNTLNLRNTKLTTVPIAVSECLHLTHLFMDNNKIECTCDLWWMKSWFANSSMTSDNISGNCEMSSETLSYYVSTGMTQCSKR